MLRLMLLGAALGLLFAVVAWRRPLEARLTPYAVGLLVAALLYPAFAGFGGNRPALALEGAGVALYGTLAFVGWRRWPFVLSIGWALHVVWDLWLPRPAPVYVPDWYPAICVGFDIAVAAAAMGLALPRAAVVNEARRLGR